MVWRRDGTYVTVPLQGLCQATNAPRLHFTIQPRDPSLGHDADHTRDTRMNAFPSNESTDEPLRNDKSMELFDASPQNRYEPAAVFRAARRYIDSLAVGLDENNDSAVTGAVMGMLRAKQAASDAARSIALQDTASSLRRISNRPLFDRVYKDVFDGVGDDRLQFELLAHLSAPTRKSRPTASNPPELDARFGEGGAVPFEEGAADSSMATDFARPTANVDPAVAKSADTIDPVVPLAASKLPEKVAENTSRLLSARDGSPTSHHAARLPAVWRWNSYRTMAAMTVGALALIVFIFLIPPLGQDSRHSTLTVATSIERYGRMATGTKGPEDQSLFSLERYRFVGEANTGRRFGWLFGIDDEHVVRRSFGERQNGRILLEHRGQLDVRECYEFFVMIFADQRHELLDGDPRTWLGRDAIAELQSLAGQVAPRERMLDVVKDSLSRAGIHSPIEVDLVYREHRRETVDSDFRP